MTSTNDDGSDEKARGAEPQEGAKSGGSMSRRGLLRVTLAMGVVFVVAGVASLAKSLFSPANPPTPEAVQTKTPTVTVTVTEQGSETSSGSTSEGSGETTTSTTTTSSSPFPRLFLAKVGDLVVSTPVEFNYPLEETPNILVKLGVKAVGGVGTDGDIVAFSQVCQHLGCIYAFVPQSASPACDDSYSAAKPTGYCCCHGTTYDLTNAGKVTGGPAPRPVPQVQLEVDSSGNIYAVGMGPPTIFGHSTGSNNVLQDLQGGTLVSGS